MVTFRLHMKNYLNAILFNRMCLSSDLFNLIRVFSIEVLNGLAEVSFDALTDAHGLSGVDEIDGDAVLAEATSATDSVQISLTICHPLLCNWQIEIHNNVDLLNVNASTQNVCGDQDFLVSLAESIQHSQSLVNC